MTPLDLSAFAFAPLLVSFVTAFVQAAKRARTRQADSAISKKDQRILSFLLSYMSTCARPSLRVPTLEAIASLVMAHKSRSATLDVLARMGVTPFGSRQWHRRWRRRAQQKAAARCARGRLTGTGGEEEGAGKRGGRRRRGKGREREKGRSRCNAQMPGIEPAARSAEPYTSL